MADDASCPFTCQPGYVKKTTLSRSCAVPQPGHYADAQGNERACNGAVGYVSSFSSLGGQAVVVADRNSCPFTCDAGSNEVRDEINRACVSTCSTGYVKDVTTTGKCRAPSPDHYADGNGDEQVCNPNSVTDSVTLGGETGSVANDASCPFTCQPGYVKDRTNRICRAPLDNHYADANGDEKTCASITHSSALGGEALVGIESTSCPFTCSAGYVKNANGRACNSPDPNKYADENSVEKRCRAIPHSASLGGSLAEGRTIADATQCPFTCSTGYVQDASGHLCRPPFPGHYADGDGNQQSCTAIAGSATLGGVAESVADENSCSFTCREGHAVVHRTCRLKRTVTDIGAGADHTCVVLDDGSVQCWGLNGDQQKDGTSTNNTNRVTVNLGQKALAVESGASPYLRDFRGPQCQVLGKKIVKAKPPIPPMETKVLWW